MFAGVTADLPNPTVDAGTVKSATRQILARPEFRPKKRNLLQAAWHWLTTQLGKVLDHLVRGGSLGSVVESVVVVLVVVAAAGLLVWLVVRHHGGWGRRPHVPGAQIRSHRPARTAADWRADAAAHAAAGRWRDALRCRYRALVAELAGRGLIEEIPGRTAGEYRRDVRAVLPASALPFDGATDLFEQAWYGDADAGPADQGRFDELARGVLAHVGGGQDWRVDETTPTPTTDEASR